MTHYHRIRAKGPWDNIDYTLCFIVVLWFFVAIGSLISQEYGWFVIPKSPWIFAVFIIPVACGIVAILHNPDICNRHGYRMNIAMESYIYCKMCDAEEQREFTHYCGICGARIDRQ